MMKIYNSLTRRKEDFVPICEGAVGMYVCGQTVYDYCHLGHARKAIVFDMIRRWFIASGYTVTFVENITDIDDKIIKRALENSQSINELTAKFINYMHEDFDKLGIMRPDLQPKATEYVPHMLSIIDDLVSKGYAYHAANGDVYYAVRKFADYGKLSGKSLTDLYAGERVEIDQNKRDPFDFVLWKSAKEHEPHWNSQFGKGRPGWHIECSAMAEQLLGKTFDIHGGGHDLQFPHHENEIAQSEAYTGCKLANLWMHNGFLNINDEKMSKSLGNFFVLRDVLKEYHPEVIRLFILKTHYRSPLNFKLAGLDEAKHGLTRLYTAIKACEAFAEPELSQDVDRNATKNMIKSDNYINFNWDNAYAKKFKLALDDDFNTSLAIGVLFEICSAINIKHDIELVKLLVSLANILGLLTVLATDFLQANDCKVSSSEIEQLIIERNQARVDKNFALSDKIRNELLARGIILEDSAGKTTWRKA